MVMWNMSGGMFFLIDDLDPELISIADFLGVNSYKVPSFAQ